MSDRAKKIIFIIVFIVLTALLGYLLYYLFLRPSPAIEVPPVNNANELPTNGLPTAGENTNRPAYINVNGQLIPAGNINTAPPSGVSPVARGGVTSVKTLTQDNVAAAALDTNGSGLVYYNKDDGKFYRIDSSGKAVAMSDKVFYNVDQVYWAPDRQKVVLKYPDGSNIIYNFQDNKQITLPKYWKDFSFSPTSSQIAFKSWTVDENGRWLSVVNSDGSGLKRLETLGTVDSSLKVDWSPNRQIVATLTKGLDFERQYLYFIGQNQEKIDPSIVEGRDYRSIWSPEGSKLVYSVFSSATDLNPALWVVDGSGETIGQNRVPLELPTWADKCAFSSASTLYCAVPVSLEKGSGLVPEYAASVPDVFYKVDLKNYSKSLVAVPEGSYNAKNLSISKDGQYLYFTDQFTGKLQQIKIK